MLETLKEYQSKGLLFSQVHPTLFLSIWNYSDKCQWENLWDAITLSARGLVVDNAGNVVARPFKKFFNLSEGKTNVTSEYEIFEKMDGCFSNKARLNLWNGGTISIGEVVKNKLTPTLIGMDDAGNLVPTKVTNWFDNGLKNDWMSITLGNPCSHLSGSGAHPNKMYLTPNHQIYRNGEYVIAGSIKKGDILTTYEDFFENNDLFIGGLLGDGSISKNGKYYRYSECHGENQRRYIKEMKTLFNGGLISHMDTTGGYSNTKKIWLTTQTSPTFTKLREVWYPDGIKIIPQDLGFLNDAIVAKWYMDDGCRVHTKLQNDRVNLHTNGFSKEDVIRIAEYLESKYGVKTNVSNFKGWQIRINYSKGTIHNFWKAITPYIFPSMEYKLPLEYRNKFKGFPAPIFIKKSVDSIVLDTSFKEAWHANNYGKTKTRAYDIETETHNYMCHGVLVHNSLGILFFYNDEWIFASRGSFTSDQAIKGREILDRTCNYELLDKNNTYCFEILYPQNKIVCDYGDIEECILTGVFETKSGEEQDLYGWELPVALTFTDETPLSELYKTINNDEEGYVIRFSNGERCKIKGAEYLRLHKMMSEMSTTAVWDCLRNGDSILTLLVGYPDEFYKFVKEYEEELKTSFNWLISSINAEYKLINNKLGEVSNKTFAEKIKNNKFKSFLFSLRNGKDTTNQVWKFIKPEYKRL